MCENVKQKSTMNPPQQQHYDQVKLFSIFEHCLFCGNQENVQTNEKYKHEGQDVFQVRFLLLQDSIKTAASNRGDKWAEEVLHRVQSVVDLPTGDAIYHQFILQC